MVAQTQNIVTKGRANSIEEKSCIYAVFVALLICTLSFSGANAANSIQQKEARKILDETGVKGGLIVHIGCAEGKLTAALCANDGYLVHGLDEDVQDVDKAHEYITWHSMMALSCAWVQNADVLNVLDE